MLAHRRRPACTVQSPAHALRRGASPRIVRENLSVPRQSRTRQAAHEIHRAVVTAFPLGSVLTGNIPSATRLPRPPCERTEVLGFAPRPFDRLALSRMKRPSRPDFLRSPVTRRRSYLKSADVAEAALPRPESRVHSQRGPACWALPHCLCIGNLVRFRDVSNRGSEKIFKESGKIVGDVCKSRRACALECDGALLECDDSSSLWISSRVEYAKAHCQLPADSKEKAATSRSTPNSPALKFDTVRLVGEAGSPPAPRRIAGPVGSTPDNQNRLARASVERCRR